MQRARPSAGRSLSSSASSLVVILRPWRNEKYSRDSVSHRFRLSLPTLIPFRRFLYGLMRILPSLHPAVDWLALAGTRNENGNGYTDSRPAVYPAAESGRGIFYCRATGPVERLSARAFHGGTRSRSKTETDAVHDARVDRRRDAAARGRAFLRLCGFVSPRRFPDGAARRARSGPGWRRDHYDSGTDFGSMA